MTRGSGRGSLSLLVVDDHRMFADVLSTRLRRESGVLDVTSAYSLGEARVLVERTGPDVVLMDYHLAGELGTTLIPDLRRRPDPPTVVMLSASEEAGNIIDALAAGAAAWVTKGTPIEVLMSAIDEVQQGHTYLQPTTLGPVIEALLHEARAPYEPTFVDELSERQLEVLRCLVAGLTRAEIAARLYISPNTARTHVQNLMQIAGEHSTLALVARARSVGVTAIDSCAGPASSS